MIRIFFSLTALELHLHVATSCSLVRTHLMSSYSFSTEAVTIIFFLCILVQLSLDVSRYATHPQQYNEIGHLQTTIYTVIGNRKMEH